MRKGANTKSVLERHSTFVRKGGRARERIRTEEKEEVVLRRMERNVHYSIPAERGQQSGLIK